MHKNEIENYIESLEKSENTKLSYRRDLTQLMNYLNKYKGDVKSYLEEIKRSKASTSASRIYSSLNGYFRWAVKNGIEEVNPMEKEIPPRVVKKERSIPTADEISDMISMPKGFSAKAVRDRAMLTVIAETGMRASRVTELKLEDAEQLVLSGPAKEILDDYIFGSRPELASKECDILFPSCDGKQMSRQGFWKMVKSYGQLSPQTFRNHYLSKKQ